MWPRKLRGADDARACLAAVAGSGLSRARWAQENGVDARSLNAWRLNLERRTRSRAPPPVRLVEWVARDEHSEEPAVYVVRCGEYDVEVDHRFDDDVLRRLIGVVSSC